MKKAATQSVLTQEQVLSLLNSLCEEEGSQRAWAKRQGLSTTLVTMTLGGDRLPAKKILKALGLKRVIHYTKE